LDKLGTNWGRMGRKESSEFESRAARKLCMYVGRDWLKFVRMQSPARTN
jgi:hypothetical protein